MRKNNYSDNANIFEYYFVDKENREYSGKIEFIKKDQGYRLDVSQDNYNVLHSEPLNEDQQFMKDIFKKYSGYQAEYMNIETKEEIKTKLIEILKRFEFDNFVPSEEMVTDDNIDDIQFYLDYSIRSLILLKHLGLSYKEMNKIEEDRFKEYSLITVRGIEYKVIPDSELNDLIEEKLYDYLEDEIYNFSKGIDRVEIDGGIARLSRTLDIEVDASILGDGYNYDEELYDGDLYYIIKMD